MFIICSIELPQFLIDFEVFTFEPDHVKAILATQFATFEKGPMAFEQAKSTLGSGVFNSDGDIWKFHCTMTRPFFIKDRISDFSIFAIHADEALFTLNSVIDEFVTPLMEKAIMRKQMKNDELDGEKTESLLDHLAQQTGDPAVLKDELVNLLVAGRDTTGSPLTFSLYMLAEHPDIAQRLRDEILNKVGVTEYPSYENIRDMKYLRVFLNEVLRLCPPVPMNSRTANKDTVFESKTPGAVPLYIPAGTRVSYSVFMMHRRTDLWGPDALEFDPGRFINERLAKYLTHNPFISARLMLARYAYQEASFFLIRLLQQYSSFSLARDAQPIDSLPPKEWAGAHGPGGSEKIHPQAHLTMYSKGGLWVCMQEATLLESI
ncbi:cytochrome P450 [Cyathus striatus]|nr:cytochrome P450 [Cyathus striatus]